ncbi:hypothetical protein FraEuI1c_3005 [Pseudofrankia inefficax]|uniref:Uncharacterized protein n=1 Tax=Pseudofrankia inefficax (strain DSM 45817 / CECT 9037 / DDB 130130 / EuI1c) TaxID=298654 RepID=E3JBL0_PSEI1|nr:hypothetical protein FraEuI1c_3005 [Pseudofrankia inefficax]
MSVGLSVVEVAEFAEVFADVVAARVVLESAGLVRSRHPGWTTAVEFWSEAGRLLAAGVVVDGRARLMGVAAGLFPGNEVFAAGVAGGLGDGGRGLSVWGVPERLVRFVGREDLLEEVHAAAGAAARVSLVALDGLGGVGKTALALEYAHRHRAEFDVVWWVVAERAELVEARLAELAGPLGLPAESDADAVWAALRGVASWLVVFDNVEEVAAVARFRPSGGGRVLVTSRNRAVRGLGSAWIEVPTLERSASLELLESGPAGADHVGADRVAALLGDLPLAVDQAAGYLARTGISAQRYARLVEAQPGVMLGRGQVVDRPDTVASVWQVSVTWLRAENPAAVGLLELCAWCGPEPIPVDLFTGDHVDWPETAGDRGGLAALRVAAGDSVAWEEAVGALVGYSLARRDGDALVVHRLVAAVTREDAPDGRSDEALRVLAGLLCEVLPGDVWGNPGGWPAWRVLLPHALAVAESARGGEGQLFADGCWLADRTATYWQGHGQLPAAIGLFEQTLTDRERVLGAEHPDTLISRNNLAYAYRAVGRVEQAIGLFEQTLTDRERVLGAEHPDTLISRNDLAGAYETAGRVEQAIGLYEQTLTDRERVLGAEHPDTLISRNNLAGAYETAGRVEQAIGLYEQTLTDRERVLGAEHPDTLISRNNLAGAYETAGRVEQAIGLYEQTLTDRERVLGAEHPDTLISRNNLAGAYETAGRVEQAIGLYEQTMAVAQRVLDQEHPWLATFRANLKRAREATATCDSSAPS